MKNFSTYKDECGHFLPFICKNLYERLLSNYFECCIETSQSMILACFCKVKKQPGEKVAYTENEKYYQNILLERSQHNFCMSQ